MSPPSPLHKPRQQKHFVLHHDHHVHKESPWPLVTITLFALTTILAVSILVNFMFVRRNYNAHHDLCLVSNGKYQGIIYESQEGGEGTGATVANKCLVESPWMRLAQHTVRFSSSGSEKGRVVDDWLWIDYHDRVNVLVEDPESKGGIEPRFLIFQQTKYALNSKLSLAVVGGIVEPNRPLDEMGKMIRADNVMNRDIVQEEPILAAQREVSEELNVKCQSWTELGKFRTDVNRGMGWVHPFLARDCSYGDDRNKNDAKINNDETSVGAHDREKQMVNSMSLSEVRMAVMEGKFVEVQWSNTVALAMLRLEIV